MRKVKGAVLGAGCRPAYALTGAVRKDLLDLKYIYDVDPHRAKYLSSELFGDTSHAIEDPDFILSDPSIDCIFIMTPERIHRTHVEWALQTQASLFLEKPVATTAEDTLAIYQMLIGITDGRKKQIGFVLRYAPFYTKIRQILDSGCLGDLTLIRCSESLGFGHGTSFFRRWHRSYDNTGGLLNEKCSHDLDLMNWYVGSFPIRVSSFKQSSLLPPNSALPRHCTDCALTDCIYRFDIQYPVGVHMTDRMLENPKAYDLDLCVYNSGHDIADRQSVMVQYENGVLGTFAVNLLSGREEREIAIYGDRGMLKGNFKDGHIEIWKNQRLEERQVIPLEGDDKSSGHGGGDDLIIQDFIHAVANPHRQPLARIEDGIISSLMAFAAEKSAQEDRSILISEMLNAEIFSQLRTSILHPIPVAMQEEAMAVTKK